MYSMKNIVNNIIITLYGDRWLLYFLRRAFLMHINVESLCCTPETNTVCQLYFNNFLKINTRDKKGVGGWQSG